jgi:hypothetical protein
MIGIDRVGIERNENGTEEPSSADPEVRCLAVVVVEVVDIVVM